MHLCVALLPGVMVCNAFATTFYVDGINGRDANDGSRSHPWKSIHEAAEKLTSGDTVLVLPGAYHERIHVTRSGAEEHPITYKASGRAITGGFTIHADYIRLVGFEITSENRLYDDNYGVYVRGQHDDILDNYIHDIYNEGIILDGSGKHGSEATAYNVVRGNRIYRASGCGIHVDGKANLIEGNDISRMVQYPPGGPMFEGADADGIRPFGTGHVIRNNRIHDIRVGDLGNLDPHIDCFETWGPATNILFENNVCDIGTSEYVPVQGAQIENGSGLVNHLTFRNNHFSHVRIGIHFERLGTTDITAIRVVHNVFADITRQALLVEGRTTGRVESNRYSGVGAPQKGSVTPEAEESGSGNE
jgi:hypothetical protein